MLYIKYNNIEMEKEFRKKNRNLFELFKLYYLYNVMFQSNTIFLNKKGEARRTHTEQ